MAGTRGPAPKRSTMKAGHHTTDPKPAKVKMKGRVAQPPPRDTWSRDTKEWYLSLPQSGEAQFFEPSDWQYAMWVAELMEDYRRDPSAALAQVIQKGMGDLGVTETARRRGGIEVEREQEEDEDAAEALAEIRILASGE